MKARKQVNVIFDFSTGFCRVWYFLLLKKLEECGELGMLSSIGLGPTC